MICRTSCWAPFICASNANKNCASNGDWPRSALHQAHPSQKPDEHMQRMRLHSRAGLLRCPCPRRCKACGTGSRGSTGRRCRWERTRAASLTLPSRVNHQSAGHTEVCAAASLARVARCCGPSSHAAYYGTAHQGRRRQHALDVAALPVTHEGLVNHSTKLSRTSHTGLAGVAHGRTGTRPRRPLRCWWMPCDGQAVAAGPDGVHGTGSALQRPAGASRAHTYCPPGLAIHQDT